MSKIIERIAFLIKTKGVSTRAFELSIGASNGMIGRAVLKGTDINAEWLSKIIDAYPDVNADWLLTGEGEIFKTKSTEKVIKSNDNLNDNQFDNKRKVQKKLSNYEPQIITLDRSDIKLVPIVDITSAAGDGACNPDYSDKIGDVALPANLLKHGVHECVGIRGESMLPTLQSGGYIIHRLLDRSEWEDIKNERVYTVVDREGLARTKRLRNRLREGGFLVLTSDNPDKATYPNLNLYADEIHCIFEVEWYLSAKIPNIHDAYYSRMQGMIDDIDDLKAAMAKLLKKPH